MADLYPDCIIIDEEVDVENPEEGLKQILEKVKPNWKGQELSFKSPMHGLQALNRPFIISTVSDTEKEDAVFVKLRKENKGATICPKDEDREFHNWRQLNKYAVGVPLLARFKNGVILKFIQGSLLTMETTNDPHISKLVAEELAKIHDASLKDELHKDKSGEPEDLNWYESRTRLILQKLKEYETNGQNLDALSHYLPVDELEREFHFMKDHLKSLNMELVICHNDCWRDNIIYDKLTDKVAIIDYEMLDIYYSPFDLGIYISACADNPPEKDKLPDQEFSKAFVRNYLVKRKELRGESGKDVTIEDVEHYYRNACLCMTLQTFYVGVICLYYYLHNRTDWGWKVAIGCYQFYRDIKPLFWQKRG